MLSKVPEDSPMLPFRDAPEHPPRHSIRIWAGLFSEDNPPSQLHPIIIVYGCMARKFPKKDINFTIAQDFISKAMKSCMNAEGICHLIGDGNPLSVWPHGEFLQFLHSEIMDEWMFINRPLLDNVINKHS